MSAPQPSDQALLDTSSRDEPIDIACGTLIDDPLLPPRGPARITIQGGEVVRIARPQTEDGKEDTLSSCHVLDFSNRVVIPGLVDCHTHLGFELGDLDRQASQGGAWATLRAVRHAGIALATGTTTVRDLGSPNGLAVDWRDATASGLMRGPRIHAAGTWLTRTGGHVWAVGREVDGVAEVLTAVRLEAKRGATWVKLVASGGILTPSSELTQSGLSASEMAVAVEEAHVLGLKVTAHAHGGRGLTAAIRAGVDAIEHGTFAQETDLALMADAGTTLVATYGVLEAGLRDEQQGVETRRKMGAACEGYLETLANAHRAGVNIAVGTDMHHGHLAEEVTALHRAGLSNAEALAAPLSTAGALMGEPGIGRLVPGGPADLVCLLRNPLDDLTALDDVDVVMIAGEIVWRRNDHTL